MRDGDRGAVLFLLRTRAGEWMAIVALLERAADGWDEIALVHKPWWDPADPFEDDELMRTGGHSRFVTGPGPEVVLIAGQAAAGASITGVTATSSCTLPPAISSTLPRWRAPASP